MKNLTNFIDQLIWKSELDDRAEESKNMKLVRGVDGWMTYHLKLLKEEMGKEFENAENKREN